MMVKNKLITKISIEFELCEIDLHKNGFTQQFSDSIHQNIEFNHWTEFQFK